MCLLMLAGIDIMVRNGKIDSDRAMDLKRMTEEAKTFLEQHDTNGMCKNFIANDVVPNNTNNISISEDPTNQNNTNMEIVSDDEESFPKLEIHPERSEKNSKKIPQKSNSIENNPAIFLGENQITEVEDENEGFQFQKVRKNKKRTLSGEQAPIKKIAAEQNPQIALNNKYEELGKKIEEINVENNNIQKIPPVVLKRTENYKIILNRINEIHKIKCSAKPTGEYFHIYCETPEDHRKLTKYLDEEKLEYYVISTQAEKPTKVPKMTAEEYSLERIYQIYLQEDLTHQRIQRCILLPIALEMDYPDLRQKTQDLIEKFQEPLDLIISKEANQMIFIADRIGISDKAVASAALQDLGVITEEDKTYVIDRMKIRRATSTNRRATIVPVSLRRSSRFVGGDSLDAAFLGKRRTECELWIMQEFLFLQHSSPIGKVEKFVGKKRIEMELEVESMPLGNAGMAFYGYEVNCMSEEESLAYG
ncbi:hypothetical protein HNY73_022976 [Argiope bruennichi]|uniref:Uncharacterized protein n=1 Tax=Argiope bruennichi TaxID=94029 RepID=A0A8T0E3F4_ARGBR|nr:hypothetical protein HNY73_022976 [Argiope bruennichi]